MFTEITLPTMQVPCVAAVFNLISSHDKPESATEKDLSPTAIFLVKSRRSNDNPKGRPSDHSCQGHQDHCGLKGSGDGGRGVGYRRAGRK